MRFSNDMNPYHQVLRMTSRELSEAGKALWRVVLRGTGYRRIRLQQVVDHTVAELDKAKVIYILPITKTHPVLFRKRDELRHGVLQKRWHLIEKVPSPKRRFCFVGVCECFRDENDAEWSGSLLLQGIGKLGRPIPSIRGTDLDDSWLFPRDRFNLVANVQVDWFLAGTVPEKPRRRFVVETYRVLKRCSVLEGFF